MGFGVLGKVLGVSGFKSRVSGLGSRDWGLGFRFSNLGFGVWGLGFGVGGLGLRDAGFTPKPTGMTQPVEWKYLNRRPWSRRGHLMSSQVEPYTDQGGGEWFTQGAPLVMP